MITPMQKSVTSLRRGPPLPSKPEYKARLLRASPRRCAHGLRIIEAQVTSPHTHTHAGHIGHTRGGAVCHTQSITLTTHGDRVERRRRRQRHARADGFGRGGAATAWAAAAPSATSTPSAQLERGQAQGSVAACGARLSVSGGGRHVARREDDKCASHGSLFIGQSSGTQVETEHGRRKAGGAEAGGR